MTEPETVAALPVIRVAEPVRVPGTCGRVVKTGGWGARAVPVVSETPVVPPVLAVGLRTPLLVTATERVSVLVKPRRSVTVSETPWGR